MKSGEVKLFIGICIVALLLVGVAVYPMMRDGGKNGPEPPPPVKITRDALIPAWSRMKGDAKAPYTLVEFGDYQCGACATGKYTVRELLDKYKGKLSHVFHHVQISGEHNWAPLMARAAEAAGRQGKFWEYHAELFENQARFKHAEQKDVLEALSEIGKKLKLDVVSLRSDMNKPEIAKLIGQMEVLARQVRIDTTPSYFLVPQKGDVVTIGSTSQLEDFVAKPDALK